MARPTVAFFSTMGGFPWGGSEELWSQAALILRQRGICIHVNVKKWSNEAPQVGKLQSAGCHIVRRPTLGRIGRLRRRVLGDETKAWLRSAAPDLTVVSQGANFDGIEVMRACRAVGSPYAAIAQAAGEFWWPNDEVASTARHGYEGARMAYFVSKANLALTERMLAMRIPRAKVVRNPFNVPYDASPPWPEKNGEIRLACVARLEPQVKGQDLIVDVLRSDRWRGRKISVSLFGAGPGECTLRELAKLHAVEAIRFHGFTASIEDVWARHHALILPTRAEGLPLALVEAALCGRPSIVTDVGGNTELVEDGVTGFVAPAATTGFIDEALERAWTSVDKLPKMGAEAARRARAVIPADPAKLFADELMGLL